MISGAARDLTDLGTRLSDVETLILNAKNFAPLQIAEKDVLSIKTDLAGLETVATSHVALCDQFTELTERVDDIKTTLIVRLCFAEKDFFRACNSMCDLEIREKRGDALRNRFGFFADLDGVDRHIQTAKQSAEIGKGLYPQPKRQREVQRELQELESKAQQIRSRASLAIAEQSAAETRITSIDTTEVSQGDLNSAPPTPRSYSETSFEQPPTKTEPPKEKTLLEKINDFFASIEAFFYRLFEKLFS